MRLGTADPLVIRAFNSLGLVGPKVNSLKSLFLWKAILKLDDMGGKAGSGQVEQGQGDGGREWRHGWSLIAGSKLKGER